MRVGLVADIPDEAVVRRIKNGVDGDGELHNAEARAEMAAGFGNGLDHVAAEFFGEDFKLLVVQALHVGGDVNPVEKGSGLRRCRVVFCGLFH